MTMMSEDRERPMGPDGFVIDVSGGGTAMRPEYPQPISEATRRSVEGSIQPIKAIATTLSELDTDEGAPDATEQDQDTG